MRNGRARESPNKDKVISFVEEMVSEGVLPISFRDKGNPIEVHISVIHEKGAKGIRTINTPKKEELQLQI